MRKTLPNKPSKLIRLALKDLEVIEKDSRYNINMNEWHNPCTYYNILCNVCLSGSVMANSFKIGIDEQVGPTSGQHSFNVSCKLLAIDSFRQGFITDGLSQMGINNIKMRDRNIVEYSNDPTKFKKQLHKLADDLEKKGL